MTSETGRRVLEAGSGSEVAAFYDQLSLLLAELIGGSLHQGYWESDEDTASMAEASTRLTDLLAEKIAVGPGDRVLDIGCGTGLPALRLAQVTGATVVGVTNSPVQAEEAARRASAAGLGDRLTFRCADATELELDAESFDAVWMIESISHLPDRRDALRRVAHVLKPGGRLALTDILDASDAPARLDSAVGALDDHAQSHGFSPLMARPVRLAEYGPLLDAAGLTGVELADISGHTVRRTLECMRQKMTEDRAALTERFGDALVEQYASVLPLLDSAGFGYALVVAAKPAPGRE